MWFEQASVVSIFTYFVFRILFMHILSFQFFLYYDRMLAKHVVIIKGGLLAPRFVIQSLMMITTYLASNRGLDLCVSISC